jgi:hypothetical protein
MDSQDGSFFLQAIRPLITVLSVFRGSGNLFERSVLLLSGKALK